MHAIQPAHPGNRAVQGKSFQAKNYHRNLWPLCMFDLISFSFLLLPNWNLNRNVQKIILGTQLSLSLIFVEVWWEHLFWSTTTGEMDRASFQVWHNKSAEQSSLSPATGRDSWPQHTGVHVGQYTAVQDFYRVLWSTFVQVSCWIALSYFRTGFHLVWPPSRSGFHLPLQIATM